VLSGTGLTAENKPTEPDMDNTSEGNRMKLLSIIFSVGLFISVSHSQDVGISGQVIDSITKEAISEANVTAGAKGSTTDKLGNFFLHVPLGTEITVIRIGYRVYRTIALSEDLSIELESIILPGDIVHVTASRAIPGTTPVAFSTLTEPEIKTYFTHQDVPMVLATEPGVQSYSESGNGTGYSYVSIRGFDQSRIAVMLDNVPLNDNESHQVYWLDHGDLLSDAEDVQIQRGIGNSLYGSAAFGGSINVLSKVRYEDEDVIASFGAGSYNTKKSSLKYTSGERFGENWAFSGRLSHITSDGYREDHSSTQRALSLSAEFSDRNVSHKFTGLIGYENTDLLWDGVYGDDIFDREKRRLGGKAFTDDFLQQIYALNSRFRLQNESVFHNTFYLVLGSGYYEANKSDVSFYNYNLDAITDSSYADTTTNLLRRKWLVNRYVGFVPQWTKQSEWYRLDIGGEIRYYSGNHYGEISDFSHSLLNDVGSYQYYDYTGKKISFTGFVYYHYQLTDELILSADVQLVNHGWNIDQDKIGHAKGHQLSANWVFVNPKFGGVYSFNNDFSMFASVGQTRKEPADAQIINPDEWSFEIKGAYPEIVSDFEFGANYTTEFLYASCNAYWMDLEDEILRKISSEEEGTYDYTTVPKVMRKGLEFDFGWKATKSIKFKGNFTVSRHEFSDNGSELKGNTLPNNPDYLANATLFFRPLLSVEAFIHGQLVGKRFVDDLNTETSAMAQYHIMNIGVNMNRGPLDIQIRLNNALDDLVITHGESWGSYWPGADRNLFVNLIYTY
jgi:iron complex outermembrane receptor protein